MKAGLPRMLFGLLAFFLSIQAIRHLHAVIQHPYPLEYGEGVNLLWSHRAGMGQSIYPNVTEDQLPQLHNPYPPLYPLLTSALNHMGVMNTHPFSAGRMLSFAGLILTVAGLFSLIRRRTTSGTAFVGILLFLLSPMILRFGPMMRVDSLALGFSLQALNFLDKQKLKTAALLAALALCTKPSFATAAFSVALFAFLSKDPKRIFYAALCGLTPVVILLIWLFQQPDTHGTLHLLRLQGLPPDLNSMSEWFARFAGRHAPLLTLGMLSYKKIDGPLKFYSPLALIPLGITAWISGSQENYLMELWAVTCILSACAWPSIRDVHPGSAWLFLLLQLALFIPVAPAPVFTRTYGQEITSGQSAFLTPTATDVEIGALISAELAAFSEPVLSVDLGYLLPVHHDPVYQPYQFQKLNAAGKWSSEVLDQAIRTSEFSAILSKGLAEESADPTFSAGTQQLIDQHYTLHRVIGPWHLYRRK